MDVRSLRERVRAAGDGGCSHGIRLLLLADRLFSHPRGLRVQRHASRGRSRWSRVWLVAHLRRLGTCRPGTRASRHPGIRSCGPPFGRGLMLNLVRGAEKLLTT